jgi:hypothetical protein
MRGCCRATRWRSIDASCFDQPLAGYLTYRLHPPGYDPRHVHLSFEWEEQLTVDDHEQPNDIVQNTLNEPTAQSAGLTAEEYELWQGAAAPYPISTFWGMTRGMVLEGSGEFRTQLAGGIDLGPHTGREIWLRVSEVSSGRVNPATGAAFDLGIEDGNGVLAWVSSDEVGPVPRPFDRAPGSTKSMLTTLRFPPRCFRPDRPDFKISDIRAIHIRIGDIASRGLAFDVMQIVREP